MLSKSVHLSLVVIYILTTLFGFNVSHLVILDCISARMFTKKTLHILGTPNSRPDTIFFCCYWEKIPPTWKFAEGSQTDMDCFYLVAPLECVWASWYLDSFVRWAIIGGLRHNGAGSHSTKFETFDILRTFQSSVGQESWSSGGSVPFCYSFTALWIIRCLKSARGNLIGPEPGIG